ncbi:15397_t:CDS:2, partial [Cetraspora pellucida]
EVCKRSLVSGWRKITDDILGKAEAKGTLALYYVDCKNKEKKQNLLPIYSFQELQKEIKNKNNQLNIFFDSIYNAANPFKRNKKYLEKLDKCLAFECYLICGNHNSKLTAFKTKMSIFLNSMKTSHEAIDAFVNAEIMITSYHMDQKKADFAKLYDDIVDSYF